jgi:hypothetical protein
MQMRMLWALTLLTGVRDWALLRMEAVEPLERLVLVAQLEQQQQTMKKR